MCGSSVPMSRVSSGTRSRSGGLRSSGVALGSSRSRWPARVLVVLSDGKGESSGTGSSKGDAASGQSSAGGLGAAEAGASGADLVRAVAVRSGTASASVGEGLGRSRTERSSGKLGAGAVQTLDRFGSDPIVGVTR